MIVKENLTRVVLENDRELSSDYEIYLHNVNGGSLDQGRQFIFHADQAKIDEILDAFTSCDILEFNPTMLTYSQYNSMIMAMYKLMMSDTLGIQEVHIYSHRHNIERELKELWGDKRMYLDQVLEHIKIYRVWVRGEKELLSI